MGEHKVLAQQEGLITRKQALDAGMSATTVGRRLQTKEWQVVFPGVYRHIAASVSDVLMVRAARLWLGPSAVLSGSWAAWWHELRAEPDGPVSITVPAAESYRKHLHLRLRRRDLSPKDVVVVRGVAVTSKSLTALENASLYDGNDVLDRALQRYVSIGQLDWTMSRLNGAHGVVAARNALADRADGTVSAPERELSRALRSAGLTSFRPGVTVQAGGCQYWLDFADPQLKIAIEVDGVAPHSDPEVFHRDRARQNGLILAGRTVLRFTPWQIRTDLVGVLRQIHAAVAAATASSRRFQ